MIYKPISVPEAKALVIKKLLKSFILWERSKSPNFNVIATDLGLVPAQGKREAIKRRIALLKTKKAKILMVLQQRRTNDTHNNSLPPIGITNNTEVDQQQQHYLSQEKTKALEGEGTDYYIVENDVIDPES